jgi:hypothetical protein
MAVFDLLLARGADPAAATLAAPGLPPPRTPVECAVAQGFGWAPGEVRAALRAAVGARGGAAARPVVPAPAARLAPAGVALLAAWAAQPPRIPPAAWRPPPPAGWAGAVGVRRVSERGWEPAPAPGDGSATLRPATDAELAERTAAVAKVAATAGAV